MTSSMTGHDEWASALSKLLVRRVDQIPLRWRRWLAIYYPDARVRREMWLRTCVKLGEGTYTNLGMIVIDDMGSGECLLEIGARVSIAPNVVFAPISAPNNSPRLQAHAYVAANLVRSSKMIVEDDVWLGAGAVVLSGATIGKGAIVGAGTVVTGDVPRHSIVAGVPAKVVRWLD